MLIAYLLLYFVNSLSSFSGSGYSTRVRVNGAKGCIATEKNTGNQKQIHNFDRILWALAGGM